MELQKNKVDKIVSVSKAISGCIPYVGSIFAEVIGNIIPDQRIDRIAKFLEKIEEKIKSIDDEVFKIKMKLPEYIDLFEDCIIASTRALTDERKDHIANLFLNGLKDHEINIKNHKRLLYLINQLDDIDLIFLKYITFKFYNFVKIDEIFIKHLELLELIPPIKNASFIEFNSYELKESHIRHLINLGLIEKNSIDGGNFDNEDRSNYIKYDDLKVNRIAVMLINEINELPEDFPIK